MLKVGCILSLLICAGHAFIICPDGKSHCEDGSTCCLISERDYGCCPYEKAVCCKDKIHCCPHGYICDLSTSSCFQGNKNGTSSKVMLKLPAKKIHAPTKKVQPIINNVTDIFRVGNVMCPDKYSICPTGTTCCLLDCGRYGCCQYSNGVCCSDHIHCCPHNYKCNIPYCSPQQQYIELPMKKISENIDSDRSFIAVIYHMCPDKKSRCGNGKKCCPAKNGNGYNCCGYHRGNCCHDNLHCCPEGFTCDIVNKKCRKKLKNIPMSVKLKAKSIETFAITHSKKQVDLKIDLNKGLSEIICPDKKTKCADNNTCCDNASGATFCCPFPDAVCCLKTSHCCPKGFVCEPGGAGLCNKSPNPPLIDGKLYDVTCPDGVSQCPDNNTCCIIKSGGYGCCPIVDAVCCKDKKHCCPSGYKCNDGKQYCVQGDHKIPFSKPTKAIIVEKKVAQLKLSKGNKFITCGDGSKCKYGSSCCQTSHGYGCCPLLKAVCCKDKKHCCPHNLKCTKRGYCSVVGKLMLASTYTNSLSVQGDSKFTCPDKESKCYKGETCCRLQDGQYGCCPLPSAVCCKDQEHCCPHGYTCYRGYCSAEGSARLLESMHSLTVRKVFVVKCPDGVSKCPDGNTCCKLSNGRYGCCPLAHAVCCSDHLHCCPHGYTCSSKGFCSRGSERIRAVKHVKAMVTKNIMCPDGLSECDKDSTCCKLATSGYGCCPLPQAVCCSDKLHCCPKGFNCTKKGYCMSDQSIIPAVKHRKAVVVRKKSDGSNNNIICQDRRTVCKQGMTCCKSDQGYKCCPLPNAVCCADKVHCCPTDHKCIKGGRCRKGNTLLLASKNVDLAVLVPIIIPKEHKIHHNRHNFEVLRIPRKMTKSLNSRDIFLLSILRHKMKVCADGYRRCQQYETCCPSSEGYVCCPFYNGVCCGDRCCPEDSSCSSKGSCEMFHLPSEPIKFEP